MAAWIDPPSLTLMTTPPATPHTAPAARTAQQMYPVVMVCPLRTPASLAPVGQQQQEVHGIHERIVVEILDAARKTDKLLAAVNKHLNDSERTIILYRYGLGDHETHTLEQIARKLGKSRERVRQVEARAIDKLRRYASELEEFQQ